MANKDGIELAKALGLPTSYELDNYEWQLIRYAIVSDSDGPGIDVVATYQGFSTEDQDLGSFMKRFTLRAVDDET